MWLTIPVLTALRASIFKYSSRIDWWMNRWTRVHPLFVSSLFRDVADLALALAWYQTVSVERDGRNGYGHTMSHRFRTFFFVWLHAAGPERNILVRNTFCYANYQLTSAPGIIHISSSSTVGDSFFIGVNAIYFWFRRRSQRIPDHLWPARSLPGDVWCRWRSVSSTCEVQHALTTK